VQSRTLRKSCIAVEMLPAGVPTSRVAIASPWSKTREVLQVRGGERCEASRNQLPRHCALVASVISTVHGLHSARVVRRKATDDVQEGLSSASSSDAVSSDQRVGRTGESSEERKPGKSSASAEQRFDVVAARLSLEKSMHLRSDKEPAALPFLPAPAYKSFAANAPGDAGFDPLGLCTDPMKFVLVRDLELKNGRLAMLAAVCWPLSELLEPIVQRVVGTSQSGSTEAATAAVVAVLNGESIFFFWGCLLTGVFMGISTLLAETAASQVPPDCRTSAYEDMVKGLHLYDPLGLEEWEPKWLHTFAERNGWMPEGRRWMLEAEIKHSRLAMIIMVVYIVEELSTGAPLLSFAAA